MCLLCVVISLIIPTECNLTGVAPCTVMLKQRLSAFDAIKFVKKCECVLIKPRIISNVSVGRPAISPNFGFVDQLEVFQQCNYQPSPTHEAYLLWKHERDAQVNNLLDTIDVVAVVPDLFFVIL